MCSFLKIRKFFALGVIVVLTISCSKYSEELYPTSGDDECRVEIAFGVKDDPFMVQSRALTSEQESQILDVNLYAVHSKTGEVKHQYIRESSNVVLSMYTGTWTLYAFANSGYDMGETTAQGLEVIVVDTRTEDALASNGKMRMAKKQIVEISDNLSIRLELERLAAKVQISVSVSAAISDQLIIQGVQMCNVPISARYIGENNAITFYNYAKQEVSGNAFSRIYYLPENLAGEVQTITRPEERSPDNAPGYATFFRIDALSNDGPVTYYVYLGENDTDDFNVTRNTVQHLNITLCGSNPNDLRVARFSLSLGSIASSYLPLDVISTPFAFTAENQKSNQFTLACKMTQGSGRVLLDGTDITSTPISLPSTGSSRTLSFEPNTYGQQVAFTLTVSDTEGRQVSRTLSTYIKPRGELLLSMPSLGRPMAGSRSTFPITISEENYNRSFRLQLTTATSQSIASFYFQGQKLTPGVPSTFTVNAATHQVEIAAANTSAKVDLTAMVTDTWGDSKSITQTAYISYDTIHLSPHLSIETQRESGPTGAYKLHYTVVLWVLADRELPIDVTIKARILCTGRYTVDNSLKTEAVSQSLTIPAGAKSAFVRIAWPMKVPIYYERNDLVADHGYAYSSLAFESTSCSPLQHEGMLFYVNLY